MNKPISQSYTKKVAYNTTFQLLGKIVTTLLSLYIVRVLTRYLGVAGYGMYTTIFAYVSFWAVLADFGYYWVIVRELSKPGANHEKIFNNILTLKICFSLLVFFTSVVISLLIPEYNQSIRIGILIIATSWFWMSLNSTYVSYFQHKLEMYKSVITEVIGRSVIAAGVYFLVINHASFNQILILYILGNFINFLASYLFAYKHIPIRLRFDFDFWKIVVKESYPLAIITFIGLINFKFDTIMLSVQKTQTDVGIYGVPYKILEIIILIPGIFTGNVFPILTKYYNSNKDKFKEAFAKTIDFIIFISFPVFISLIVLARQIINFIGGEEFLISSTINVFGINLTSVHVLMILSFSIFATFLVSPFSNIITVIEKQKQQILPIAVATVFNVVTNFILIPRYSYLAAAVTTLLSEIIILVWLYIIAKRNVDFSFHLGYVCRVFVSATLMGLILYFIRDMNLFVVIVVGFISYFTFSYILKTIDKDKISRVIPNKINFLKK
jgi:O-antigen/teichoic acid export membrane protein